MDASTFRGSFVALVTPMKSDNSLDWSALHQLIEWHLEQGTHGIVTMGTTGESATLDVNEHLEVVRRTVDQVAGKVPVVAGTGANSTSEAVALTAEAKALGVDACLLVTPYYNKPTQEGLFLHHEFIAKHVAIPQLLYNVPGRTAVDMSADTAIRLSHVENIIGIKEATGDLGRLKSIRQGVAEDFVLLSGDDETALEFLLNGGHGAISVTANVAPRLYAQMCELAFAGKVEEAQRIDARLNLLNKKLFLEANPIPVKWALAQLARSGAVPFAFGEGIRLPLTPLSGCFHSDVEAALAATDEQSHLVRV